MSTNVGRRDNLWSVALTKVVAVARYQDGDAEDDAEKQENARDFISVSVTLRGRSVRWRWVHSDGHCGSVGSSGIDSDRHSDWKVRRERLDDDTVECEMFKG